MVSVPGIKLG